MKKFQTMMAVVLVALMAFVVQSCGNDDKDDLTSTMYKLTETLVFQDKGELTATEADNFQKKKNIPSLCKGIWVTLIACVTLFVVA